MIAEYEHRRRSLMFQRRALMAAFLAWLVVAAIHVTDEKYDLGHYDNILDYVEMTALVVGFLLLIASVGGDHPGSASSSRRSRGARSGQTPYLGVRRCQLRHP